MKTFVLMTKLASPDAQLVEIGSKQRDRSQFGAKWIQMIEENCPNIKFKAHYALMGYWDSMHIYDAPDEEYAAKVSLIARNFGMAQVESWVALPFERVLRLSEDLRCPEETPQAD